MQVLESFTKQTGTKERCSRQKEKIAKTKEMNAPGVEPSPGCLYVKSTPTLSYTVSIQNHTVET